MGWHTKMRNHLHQLMKRRASREDAKTFSRRDVWVADLGLWSGSSNRVSRGLEPWDSGGGVAMQLIQMYFIYIDLKGFVLDNSVS